VFCSIEIIIDIFWVGLIFASLLIQPTVFMFIVHRLYTYFKIIHSFKKRYAEDDALKEPSTPKININIV